MSIRTASPQGAAAIQAIYTPIVLHTPLSFEMEPRTGSVLPAAGPWT